MSLVPVTGACNALHTQTFQRHETCVAPLPLMEASSISCIAFQIAMSIQDLFALYERDVFPISCQIRGVSYGATEMNQK